MKGSEIEIGGTYLVQTEFRQKVKATVVAKGLERRVGFRGRTMSNGVRVRVAESVRSGWSNRETVPAGATIDITSQGVLGPWTAEHEAGRQAAIAEQERREAIEARLAALGLKRREFGWNADSGDFDWTRDALALEPDATERLLAAAERGWE